MDNSFRKFYSVNGIDGFIENRRVGMRQLPRHHQGRNNSEDRTRHSVAPGLSDVPPVWRFAGR